MISQDTTFSSGATLHRGENEREMVVPPARGFGMWFVLLMIPVFAAFLSYQYRRATETGDRILVGFIAVFVAASFIRTIDAFTRRTRFALTRTSVSMTSVGLLGTRSAECARGAFRYGHHVQPRRGTPYIELFFADKRVKACYGWYENAVTGVLIELQEWQQLPATPGMHDEVMLVNSRLRTSVEGHDRSVEIPPPRRNVLLWLALPFVPVWSGVFVYAFITGSKKPGEPVVLRFLAVPIVIIAIVVLGKVIDMLTTQTRISITPKYVALSSKGLFTRKSFTCARGDFVIGGYKPMTRNSPVTGLELLFGSTSAFVLKGADSRDIAEVVDVLESWMLQP